MKRFTTVFSLLLVAVFVLAACAPDATPEPTTMLEPTAMLELTVTLEPTVMLESTTTLEPTVMSEPTAETTPESGDIIDTAIADGRFTTFVAAVEAADLDETLKGEGPFTVFAPTDDAFAALPAGTVDNLLLPENKQDLTNTLLNHVVAAKVMAAEVESQTSVTTIQGQDVIITTRDGKVYLNDTVEIIITDIEASNGVIHVIDAVLLPAQ
jgi:transforming growth factor-beta-induced protein